MGERKRTLQPSHAAQGSQQPGAGKSTRYVKTFELSIGTITTEVDMEKGVIPSSLKSLLGWELGEDAAKKVICELLRKGQRVDGFVVYRAFQCTGDEIVAKLNDKAELIPASFTTLRGIQLDDITRQRAIVELLRAGVRVEGFANLHQQPLLEDAADSAPPRPGAQYIRPSKQQPLAEPIDAPLPHEFIPPAKAEEEPAAKTKPPQLPALAKPGPKRGKRKQRRLYNTAKGSSLAPWTTKELSAPPLISKPTTIAIELALSLPPEEQQIISQIYGFTFPGDGTFEYDPSIKTRTAEQLAQEMGEGRTPEEAGEMAELIKAIIRKIETKE